MATDIQTVDYYALENYNGTARAYSKNSSPQDPYLGYDERDSAYVAEILCSVDDTAWSGDTVTAVRIKFDIKSKSLSVATNYYATVYKNSDGDYNDNGTTPNYDDRDTGTAWPTESWPTALSTSPAITSISTGTITIPTSTELVAHFNDFADGSESASGRGVIVSMDTGNAALWMIVEAFKIEVDYTAGGGITIPIFYNHYKNMQNG